MIGCMAFILLANIILPEKILIELRQTYLGESIALMAFGIAWTVSGKTFKLIAEDDEIYHVLRKQSLVKSKLKNN